MASSRLAGRRSDAPRGNRGAPHSPREMRQNVPPRAALDAAVRRANNKAVGRRCAGSRVRDTVERAGGRGRMRGGRRRGDRSRRGACPGARRPRGAGARSRQDDRLRDFFAQQRGHPQRDLLPAGQPQGDQLRRRAPPALRLLPRTRGGPRPGRQADRRRARGRDPGVGKDRCRGTGQRRRRRRVAQRFAGAGSRTGAQLRRGTAVAVDRDHRQPCADAGLSGRG